MILPRNRHQFIILAAAVTAASHGGKVNDGRINWLESRKSIDEAGYSDWTTIEEGGLPLAEFSKRLDPIAAGE